MSERDDNREAGTSPRRPGPQGTFSTAAYRDDNGSTSGSRPSDDPREVTGGAAVVDPDIDGFRQPTAMFDKGQFLGELAELVDGAPDTRAKIEAEAKPPMGCRLIIVAGPDLGLEWGFKVPEVIMGRDEDCQLVLNDIAVSRRHAKIALEGDRFVLSDLSSGNGTYLNGVRIQQERLSPGDEIIVGERTLRFVELNEAPPTKAAHPVQADAAEPQVSDVPEPSGQFEPVLSNSKIDAAVAPEPSLGSIEVPAAAPAPSGALRRLLVVVATLVGLAALSVGGWMLYNRYFVGETPAQRALRVKREFLQGVELVKQLRCGDASILFRRVLTGAPGHPHAARYIDHCEVQIAHWRHIDAAREMASARRYIEAIDRLKEVPPESDYAEQAANDRRVYARSVAFLLLDEAREAFNRKEFDAALELVDRALELAPDLSEATQLRREITDATVTPPQPRRRKRAFSVPSALRRSVDLYEAGKIGAAIDAAEAVGGESAQRWARRMTSLKKMLSEAAVAHRRKAAGELLRVCPEALAVDRQIAGGLGRVNARLKRYYADGLYLKGIDALQSSDDISAFRLLSRAVKVLPEHKLARTRLAELGSKAREIYYDGYAMKDQDRAATRRIFKRLTQITSASNPYHKLAADWLRTNR